jgi:hypothetical protein
VVTLAASADPRGHPALRRIAWVGHGAYTLAARFGPAGVPTRPETLPTDQPINSSPAAPAMTAATGTTGWPLAARRPHRVSTRTWPRLAEAGARTGLR